MKTISLVLLMAVFYSSAVLTTTFAAARHHRHDNPQPPAVEPPTVTDVNTSDMTVTIRTGKSNVEVYQLTKLTQVVVDGKPATINGIQRGMKASITGSKAALSKIELTTIGSKTTTEEPAPRPRKKN